MPPAVKHDRWAPYRTATIQKASNSKEFSKPWPPINPMLMVDNTMFSSGDSNYKYVMNGLYLQKYEPNGRFRGNLIATHPERKRVEAETRRLHSARVQKTKVTVPKTYNTVVSTEPTPEPTPPNPKNFTPSAQRVAAAKAKEASYSNSGFFQKLLIGLGTAFIIKKII